MSLISVKSRRLKKSVAALGLVLALTLGGFTVGLAHDEGPVGATHSLALLLDVPNGVSQWVDSGPRVHLDFLAGSVVQKDQKVSIEARVQNATLIPSETPSRYQRINAP